jgi:transposase-like protein
MRVFPRSIFELGQLFSGDDSCLEYIVEARWPDGFKCPHCNGTRFYWLETRKKMIKCASCREQISLTAGTVMEKTKTSLCKWFTGAYLMTTHTPGISALQFQRQVDIPSYECAFQILHKIRASAVRPNRDKLSGYVEVDESWIGGHRLGKRGRGAEGKALVVGAIEVRGKGAARARFRRVRNASHETLSGFIKAHVEPGSIVRTDGWRGYIGIEDYGYQHSREIEESPERAALILPHFHRVISNLKAWIIGTHHGVSPKHMQAYLNEYCFRFNRRMSPWKAFETLLGLAAHSEGPTYNQLYANDGWIHRNPLEVGVE